MRAGFAIALIGGILLLACERAEAPAPAQPEARAPAAAAARPGDSGLPPLDATNIVTIALGSKDHTTLVAALKAADYVTAVAASGPLTVFAPTNAAFDALPAGTLDRLLEPANADQLREILKYHVTTSTLRAETLRDGQLLGMANGAKATIQRQGDAVAINGAHVVASIPASNGIVHVIDAVLLPPARP
jgi:uncharacterized surface protein with fasciclin (FAS1) repeats